MKPSASVCRPLLPPLCAKPEAGVFNVAAVNTASSVRVHAGFRLSGAGATPASARRCVDRVAEEQLARIAPQRVERGLHPRVAFRRSVAERNHQLGGALDVIGDFLLRLGGDLGDARVARSA